MTDKEIIINGVDVSKCSNLGSQYNCTVKANMPCKMFPNCYFKQLQKEKFENLNNRQWLKVQKT